MNEQLEKLKAVPDFEEHLTDKSTAWTDDMNVLQINVGYLCNQACKHCHLECGPDKKDELMSREVMEACLDVFKSCDSFKTIDITGGAPEMNPNLEWFLREACSIADHVIVRSNLTILCEEKYAGYPEMYRALGVNICSSLPYYSEKDTDRQRGTDTFRKSIEALKKLNELGYGIDDKLQLDLVYNPGGAFLPPAQHAIEKDFKTKLKEEYGIEFTHLFTITNCPIGRFGKFLERTRNIDRYMNLLFGAYNQGAERGMMCRFQLSVRYDGKLYDCDFNQAVDLPIEGAKDIFELKDELKLNRHIAFANHCYCCTAGQGSSCGGATS